MRILALVDFSIYGQSVIDHAAWVAASNNAVLDILHIISPNEIIAKRMPVHPGGPVMIDYDLTAGEEMQEMRAKAEVWLAEVRTMLASRGIAEVRTRIAEGNVLETMQEAAADTELIVMGKRGENADLARLPLGSSVERLVRSSTVPVLVVSRAFRPIHRAMIAFDLDSSAAGAVNAVADGHLVPPMPVLLLHAGEPNEAIDAGLASAAERLTAAGMAVTTEVAQGLPERVIPEMAVSENIDLIAMGAFGGFRLKTMIFGSLTSEVMRACQVPVLLCR